MAPDRVSNKNTFYSSGAKRNRNLTIKPLDEIISMEHLMLDKNVRDGLVNLLDDPENIQAQLQGKLEWNNSFPASITVRYHLLSSQRTSVYVQTTTLRPDH
jgi:hypothetical protein